MADEAMVLIVCIILFQSNFSFFFLSRVVFSLARSSVGSSGILRSVRRDRVAIARSAIIGESIRDVSIEPGSFCYIRQPFGVTHTLQIRRDLFPWWSRMTGYLARFARDICL